MSKQYITVYLSSVTKERLQEFCKNQQQTISSVVQSALDVFLDKELEPLSDNNPNLHTIDTIESVVLENFVTKDELETLIDEFWDERMDTIVPQVEAILERKHDRLLAQINEKLPPEIERLTKEYNRKGKSGKGFG